MNILFLSYFIGALIGSMVGYIICRVVDSTKEKPLVVKIKYFTDKYGELKMLKKTDKGDWIDLYAAEDVVVKTGTKPTMIPLGIGMILPKGYEAHVVMRSSTPAKAHILQANAFGVIDNCYNGDGDEWWFPAILAPCTDKAGRHVTQVAVKKGDRICQFRLEKNQPEILLQTVDHLEDTNRGGLGSTGTV